MYTFPHRKIYEKESFKKPFIIAAAAAATRWLCTQTQLDPIIASKEEKKEREARSPFHRQGQSRSQMKKKNGKKSEIGQFRI